MTKGQRSVSVWVRPGQEKNLRDALGEVNERTSRLVTDKRTIRRILKELGGIGELKRGLSRQMQVSRPEARFLTDLVEAYDLQIHVPWVG